MPEPTTPGRLQVERATIGAALDLVQAPDRRRAEDALGYPDEGTRWFALRTLERDPEADDEFVMYHVIEKLTGRRVGHVGFHGRPDERGHVRIGYAIAEGARRRGFATEAVGWLVRWAGARHDIAVLDADTDEANEASHRVLEANGFHWTTMQGSTRFYERPV